MYKYSTNKKYNEDCLGYWNLEEASGTTRTGSHNLTDTGGSTQVNGIDGFAAAFTSTQWLTSAAAILTSGEFSIGFWYNPVSVVVNAGIVSQMIKPNPGVGTNGTFSVYQSFTGIQFGTSDGSAVNFRGTPIGTLKADSWHSVVCVFTKIDAQNRRKIWLNGFLQDDTLPLGNNPVFGGLFRIGWSSTVVGEATGNGKIDRVRLWNRPIEDREAYNFCRNPYRW